MRLPLLFLLFLSILLAGFSLPATEPAAAQPACYVSISPVQGAVPTTVNASLAFDCVSGPWHYEFRVLTYDDADGDGVWETTDTLTGTFYSDTTHTKFAQVEYESPITRSVSLTDASPDFYLFRFKVASHGGSFHGGDGPWTENSYTRAAFHVTSATVPEFRVAIVSPNGNAPTTVDVDDDDGQLSLDAWVVNEGTKDLAEVNLTMLNATDVSVDTAIVQNVEATGEFYQRATEMTFPVPTSVGSYAFKLRGQYDNGTSDPSDDLTRWFNYTVEVVSEVLTPDFLLGGATFLQNPVASGSITSLLVTLENSGDLPIRLGVWTNYPSDGVLILPALELTIPALAVDEVRTVTFQVKGLEEGEYTVRVRAMEADTSGQLVGTTYKERSAILTVTAVPEVTTLSPDDLGPTDGILQGKIDSLGAFTSGRAYFVLWETDDPAQRFQVPSYGTVVTFVSSFREYVDFLTADTNYTVSFRLAYAGGEANGGEVQFTTPASFTDPLTGLRNGMALALGIDSIAMGYILGVIVLFMGLTLFLFITDNFLVHGIVGIAVVALNVALTWWPSWMLLVIAALVGFQIVRMLPTTGGGNGRAEG